MFDEDDPQANDTSGGVHGRKDSSVLFSLDDLSEDQSAGQQDVLTESSGLIDIRAVAKRDRSPQSGGGRGIMPGESHVGTQDSGLQRLAVAVPVVERKSNTALWVLIAVLVLGGGGAGAYFAFADTDPPPRPHAAVTPAEDEIGMTAAEKTPGVAVDETGEAKPEKVDGDKKPGEGDTPPAAEGDIKSGEGDTKPGEGDTKPGEDDPKAGDGDKKPDKKPGRYIKRGKRPKKHKKDPPKGQDPEPPPSRPASDSGTKTKNTDNVNALLSSLSGGKDSGTDNRDTAGLPKTLSASAIQRKIRGARGTFNGCYAKQNPKPPGGVTMRVSFTVAGSGKVTTARVASGGGTSAAVQSCVIGAIKRLKFSAFASASLTRNIPIRLN